MNEINSSKVHTLHQKSSTWRTRKKCLSITSGMLSVIKDVYLPKKMVESSSRGLFYEQLLLALACSAEYLTMKRLTIVFLACIKRQRFTGSLHKKAKVYQDHKSSQTNFLPFGVRKPKLFTIYRGKLVDLRFMQMVRKALLNGKFPSR